MKKELEKCLITEQWCFIQTKTKVVKDKVSLWKSFGNLELFHFSAFLPLQIFIAFQQKNSRVLHPHCNFSILPFRKLFVSMLEKCRIENEEA